MQNEADQLTFADLGLWCGKTSSEPLAPTEARTSKRSSRKSSASSSRTLPKFHYLKRASGPKRTPILEWAETERPFPSPTEYMTDSFGERPCTLMTECSLNEGHRSGAVVSRLSQILEECAPPKYRLSARACQGILTRAERRGKELPPILKLALESVIAEENAGGGLLPCLLKIRGGCEGGGKGPLIQVDKSATLSTLVDQTLFQPVLFAPEVAHALMARGNDPVREDQMTYIVHGVLNDQGGGVMSVSEDVTATLRAEDHGHPPVVYAASFKAGQGEKAGGIGYREEQAPTLAATPSGTNQTPAVVLGMMPAVFENHSQDSRYKLLEDVSETVSAKYGTGGNNMPIVVEWAMQIVVRRLMPLECERLQGYPDGWTDIGEWTDSKGKRHKEADAPRYKALGNSICLPFWAWLLKRIAAQYERPATLGSLFDGIGGFPLIWEQINGKGTARWASEIEEFPIAVTTRRFPDEEPQYSKAVEGVVSRLALQEG